jgi:ABC-type multidrug transport system fused ATPase/permease subunit
MSKAIWATPVYLSVAWALMISYQLFTTTAVETVVNNIDFVFPAIGSWLISRIDMIVIINAFAWVFVLSSVIPSIILGKERSILVQFFVCLILTIVSFVILDTIETVGGTSLEQLQGAAFLFSNVFFAVLYLALPYIVMFTLDWQLKKRQKKIRTLEEVNQEFIENIENTTTEKDYEEEEEEDVESTDDEPAD